MKNNRKSLLISIAIPLAVGALAAAITRSDMVLFQNVKKPPLTPPDWVFPAVWTVLYVLMGVASWLVYEEAEEDGDAAGALIVYGIQLIVNFFWPILFFHYQWYFGAFLWLVLLAFLIVSCIRQFARWSETASKLMIPYLIWVIFAGYLNLGVYFLR